MLRISLGGALRSLRSGISAAPPALGCALLEEGAFCPSSKTARTVEVKMKLPLRASITITNNQVRGLILIIAVISLKNVPWTV
jgi:hypothetical protein